MCISSLVCLDLPLELEGIYKWQNILNYGGARAYTDFVHNNDNILFITIQ